MDSQQDVNNAIVGMQFQDITQQKLEYMRGSILSAVMQNLDLLSVETQEMMKKDLFLAIRVEAERMNASSGLLMKSACVAEQSAGRESEPVEVSDPSARATTPVAEKETLL